MEYSVTPAMANNTAFDFNPSDAELNMYNASGTINQKIQAAYRRL